MNEGRISRGWRLTQVAWALIRRDPTMMVLAAAGIVSSILFAFLVFLIVSASSHHSSGQFGGAVLIALYPSTLAGVFFNVALACAASADSIASSSGSIPACVAWSKSVQPSLTTATA